jgi:hypothetical protein
MSNLKSLYTYNVMDVENYLDIRSETVYPLSSSQSARKYIFRLEPIGYLDQNSMLQFKLQSTNANPQRINIFNGALGAIKRATISVGDFTLNDTDEVSKWATLEHLSTTKRSTQNSFLSHYLGNQLYTTVNNAAEVNDADPEIILDGVGSLVIDQQKSGLCFGGYLDSDSIVGAYKGLVANVNSQLITQNKNNNFQYGIKLGLLFPCLMGRTLPLYLFNEYRIYITFEFHSADKYVNNVANNDYTDYHLQSSATDITVEDVKLQVDYIIYPSSIQQKQLEQISSSKGYTMDFYDVVHIMKNLPQTTNRTKQEIEMKIGQSNREVHKLYFLRNFNNSVGRRNACLLACQCDGVNDESINWNVNGLDAYTENIVSPSMQYKQLKYALDTYLDVERPMYYTDDNTEASLLAGKYNPLQGTYKPLALDLRNGNPGIVGAGTLIGEYPINVKYSRVPHSNLNSDESVSNIFNDKTGAMNIDMFSLCSKRCVIKTNNKGGMLVNVSY